MPHNIVAGPEAGPSSHFPTKIDPEYSVKTYNLESNDYSFHIENIAPMGEMEAFAGTGSEDNFEQNAQVADTENNGQGCREICLDYF